MEVAGLVVGLGGLASIFSACVHAFDRVHKYKSSKRDVHNLTIQFETQQLRLKQWGESVGLYRSRDQGDTPPGPFHMALDDPEIRKTVTKVLKMIGKIHGLDLTSAIDTLSSSSTEVVETRTAISQTSSTGVGVFDTAKSSSKLWRLWWATMGKAESQEVFNLFSYSVDFLYQLVQPEPPAPPVQAPGDAITNATAALSVQVQLAADHEAFLADLQQLFIDIEVRSHQHILVSLGNWIVGGNRNHELLEFSEKRREYSDLRRMPGTCDWVLRTDQYQQWLKGGTQGRDCTLWISGPPGFGKTYTSAHIVKHLLSSTANAPVVYYFFSSDAKERIDPFLVIRAWAARLVATHPDVGRIVQDKQEEGVKGQDFTRVFSYARRPMVIQILREAVEAIPGCTLVVDGLDESTREAASDSDTIAEFIDAIYEAVSGTQTRVLITSRVEPQISDALEKKKAHNEILQYRITSPDVRSDNGLVASNMVKQSVSKMGGDSRLKIANLMIDRCAGQFQWLKMHEQSLREGLGERKLRAAIGKAPPTLDDLYGICWNRIWGHHDKTRVLFLLRLVAFSVRPLTVLELTEAIQFYEDDDEFDLSDRPLSIDKNYIDNNIIGPCWSLVEVNESQDGMEPGKRTVHLAHATIKDYVLRKFTDMERQVKDSKKSRKLQVAHHHALLADLCLRYLCMPQIWKAPSSETEVSGREEPWFRSYAASTWNLHTSSASPMDLPLEDLVFSFMDETSQHWLSWRSWFNRRDKKISRALMHGADAPGILYYACHFGLTQIVPRLLNQGDVDVNSGRDSGLAALEVSCRRGHTSIVKDLLEAGADVSIRNLDALTPLMTACVSGHFDIVELLLRFKAGIEATNDRGWDSLLMAVLNGHFEVAKLLVDKGAPLQNRTKEDWMPSFMACWNGRTDILEYLISHGIDMEAVNHENWTLAAFAARRGHTDTLKLVLSHSADITIKNISGYTPLHHAAIGGHPGTVEFLLDQGADLNDGDIKGGRPLHLASENGHVEVVRLLLSRNAEVNSLDKAVQTPLVRAVWNGRVEVAETLLSHGADPALSDSQDWAPLFIACSFGNMEILKLLQGAGARMESKNHHGWTLASFAAAHDRVDVLRYLVSQGCDMFSANKFGETPADLAMGRGYEKAASFLNSLKSNNG